MSRSAGYPRFEWREDRYLVVDVVPGGNGCPGYTGEVKEVRGGWAYRSSAFRGADRAFGPKTRAAAAKALRTIFADTLESERGGSTSEGDDAS